MSVIRWIKEISDRLSCDKAVRTNPEAFFYFPDRFKTQVMCNEVAEKDPYTLRFDHEIPCVLECIPNHLETQGTCEKAVEKDLRGLNYVPDHFRTQKMCEKAVEKYPYNLKFVPDHLKT